MSGLYCTFIAGRPRPQGSKRLARGRLIESSRALKGWRDSVAMSLLAARQSVGGEWPIEGPAIAELQFDLRTKPTARPDLDKLCRAVLDAMVEAGLLRDDSQVVFLKASKSRVDHDDEEGVWVTISHA